MDPIAHASIALMAKPLSPNAPLWALIAATEVPDILFFAFEAAGIEHQAVTHVDFQHGLTYLSPAVLPYSHGLIMCIVWSILTAVFAYLFLRDHHSSLIIGSMVFSHWLLDFLVYNNLPLLFDGSPLLGLGLITSGTGFIIGIGIEILLITAGIIIFTKFRKRAITPLA